MNNCSIQIANLEGLEYLKTIPSNSIDLVLTDPPYSTSRDTGMDKWMSHVGDRRQSSQKYIRTEAQWHDVKTLSEWKAWCRNRKSYEKWRAYIQEDPEVAFDRKKNESPSQVLRAAKRNYLKYGSIYGAKYAVKTDYGKWDSEFSLQEMNEFVSEFYRVLRPGGTCIIFFDIWKITPLKEMLENNKFKQHRFIEWIKTNPQPLNSSRNYLTNCREIALMGVKKGSPTFNSKYDNAIYFHPLQGGKFRIMPTQKSTKLCEELIEKHSNPGDTVLDPFMGSGTTAVAAYNVGRKAKGCEMRKDMYDQAIERIEGELSAS